MKEMKKANKYGSGDRKAQGFTLIELLIVSVITIIVLYGAIDFFNTQQKVFRQQSLQARNQASVRMAMHFINKDLNNAGFTGGPFGVETAIQDARQRGVTNFPVVAAKFVNRSLETDMPLLGNATSRGLPVDTQSGDSVDALEVWGNFAVDGQATHLIAAAAPGVSTLMANTVTNFQTATQNCNLSTEVCTAVTMAPIGVVLANFAGDGEYAEVSGVNTGSRTINLASPLLRGYHAGDVVAPVWRRVYYIRAINGERWLVRREFYSGASAYIDTKIAEGVWDQQLTFDVAPSANQLSVNLDPGDTVINPILIESVNVKLMSQTRDVDQVMPVKTVLVRKVKLVNLGLHPYLRGY